jgi:DNA-binding transcriptional MerR regulator
MRISELAARTAVSVATLKYYLREGLLHRGTLTAPNQAFYDERHVSRVQLVRLLREVGGVPISRLRAVVEVLEQDGIGLVDAIGAAADALAPEPPPPGPLAAAARDIATTLIESAGWTRIRADAPDRENLRGVIEVIIASGTHEERMGVLEAYVAAADQIARFEVADLDDEADRDSLLSQIVVGQVVFGQLLATLRRLAEEHHGTIRFGGINDAE